MNKFTSRDVISKWDVIEVRSRATAKTAGEFIETLFKRMPSEEFYEVNDCSWIAPELNKQLRQWEYTYICIRPHHSLGKITPLQFLKNNGIIDDYKPLCQSHMC